MGTLEATGGVIAKELTATIRLKCTRCGGVLETGEQEVTCPECESRWPALGGIPRFYQEADYYWGEIDRHNATALLADAKKGSWKDAVRRLVPRESLQAHYLDLQRASWLALLSLKPDAVALDIGCGYGAITHSLALAVRHVCAIEAVPERIEFTQERLRQEGITNVTLLQSSATALPFFERSFDLIVVNGILEWIGEWDLTRPPRDAQLAFLSSLQRLLKDDGALVSGVENRFGLNAFRGLLDHSGKRYTSLVPRRIATIMLRHAKVRGRYSFYTPNSKREYRTYTYSRHGYGKLFKEAGFGRVSFYLAKPGYNRPHHLIPFGSRALLRDYYSTRADWNPGSSRRLLALGKAQVLTGNFYASLAADFIIIALKSERLRNKADFWLRAVLSKSASAERGRFSAEDELCRSVSTHCYGQKSVVRFWNRNVGMINAVEKFGFGSHDVLEDLSSEFKNLGVIWTALAQRPHLSVTVPKPIDYLRDGKNAYLVESRAQGMQMSHIVAERLRSRRFKELRADFSNLLKAYAELTSVLQQLSGIAPIDPMWRRLPDDIGTLSQSVNRLRYFSPANFPPKPSCIQHGDFAVANIFFNQKTGQFEVIDWADVATGLPPLYDIFSLIVLAGVSAYTRNGGADLSWQTVCETSFSEIFIERGELNSVFADLLAEACERFELSPSVIPSLLIEFLLIREQYELARYEGVPAQQYSNMLRAYLQIFD
jgi:ubiquinone/menaquinone biosynthesis C-methylase UbiE